jgi:glycosyltransferase involved in cell wall biosynthesis
MERGGVAAAANRPDLCGAVEFSCYQAPIWPVSQAHRARALDAGAFGNVVVEAQMSRRPVVAAASQGHLESTTDGETGLLVRPADSADLADGSAD